MDLIQVLMANAGCIRCTMRFQIVGQMSEIHGDYNVDQREVEFTCVQHPDVAMAAVNSLID